MRVSTVLALALCALAANSAAIAQTGAFPERNITVIVPFPAGGASDMTARLVTAKLAERVKQSVVIENRGGANGALGSMALKQAAPDGYTLLVGSIGVFAINPALFKELKSETRPRDVVRQMSGGQRQAVAIARTMLSEAKIVLMDEPTAAISVRQVAEVLNHIKHLRDQGVAIVLISHRMPDVFSIGDRVIVLRRGRKVADKRIKDSSPEEVTGLITGAIEQV